MKNHGKIIRKLTLSLLAAGMVPYRIKKDEYTGAFEVGSLLWGLKKTPGGERDKYTLDLFPLIGFKKKSAEEKSAE